MRKCIIEIDNEFINLDNVTSFQYVRDNHTTHSGYIIHHGSKFTKITVTDATMKAVKSGYECTDIKDADIAEAILKIREYLEELLR